MLNTSNVQGRFTADPEIKTTNTGAKFTSFTIASQRRKNEAGDYATDFIPCIAWGTQAEFICRNFRKGKMAIVSGRLQSRNFETDGQKRTAIELYTYECGFADSAPRQQESQEIPEEDLALDFEF